MALVISEVVSCSIGEFTHSSTDYVECSEKLDSIHVSKVVCDVSNSL